MNTNERMNFEIQKRLADNSWDMKIASHVRSGVKTKRLRVTFIASSLVAASVLIFITMPVFNGNTDSSYDLVSYQVKNTVTNANYSSPVEAEDFNSDAIDLLISSTLETR